MQLKPLNQATRNAFHEEMHRRIAICSLSRHVKRSNCRGTALYLIGARDKEGVVHSHEAYLHLRELERITIPVVGCIAAWHNPGWRDQYTSNPPNPMHTSHMGVVTSVEPLLVTHRQGSGAEFKICQPIEELNKNPLLYGYEVSYFLPMLLR